MTGPEHYREAERLIETAADILRPHDEGPCEADRVLAAAQVHATLALAAATALNDAEDGMPQSAYQEWRATAGTKQDRRTA
ncbi:hypothetical protein [Streptomyces arboris]|uniref:hypothetical protein n=1 Tax=Streptomyces arboris TaxID=2600619 RepID=UPI003BF57A7E